MNHDKFFWPNIFGREEFQRLINKNSYKYKKTKLGAMGFGIDIIKFLGMGLTKHEIVDRLRIKSNGKKVNMQMLNAFLYSLRDDIEELIDYYRAQSLFNDLNEYKLLSVKQRQEIQRHLIDVTLTAKEIAIRNQDVRELKMVADMLMTITETINDMDEIFGLNHAGNTTEITTNINNDNRKIMVDGMSALKGILKKRQETEHEMQLLQVQ